MALTKRQVLFMGALGRIRDAFVANKPQFTSHQIGFPTRIWLEKARPYELDNSYPSRR